ncbi:MAG: phosphopyruvate hydratase, partial [Patescibacteria group bacterium]|nr:phosphopyruvate hydratase [Patescibacteria group bacterium]
MSKIKSVTAQEVFDSRGNPTIETSVVLSDGISADSSVPSGASKGAYEALELRDGNMTRFNGMGVLKAVENVTNVIGPKIIGIEAGEQAKIDRIMVELDGTQNKGKLGSNATLSVSQAVAKAAAKSSLLPLSLYLRSFISSKESSKKIPVPMFNLIEGSKHASNSLDFQEFLVIPATSEKYEESLGLGISIDHCLKDVLFERNLSTLSADEGGFGPNIPTNQEALNILKQAIERANYKFQFDAFLGIDAAANSFKDNKEYRLRDRAVPYNQDDFVEFYKNLFDDYALIYIEDPFSEDDWEGWQKIYSALGDKTLIVGDDLVTTNPYRLQMALDNNTINGMIIKPNQIGTITETIAVVEMAKLKNLKIIVSHRSGETT